LTSVVAITVADVLLVPYGVAEWSPDGIALDGFTGRTLRLRTTFPCAAINRALREPLRLNSSRYDFGFAPAAAAGPADEAGIVKEYLKGLCKPWDNLSVQFLDAYFRCASDLVLQHKDALATRLAPFAGLYDPKDFLFSAPKPLPRAHVHAPAQAARPNVTPIDPADFLRVDFAFWLGDRLVAVQAAQSFLTPKKAKEHADRLRIAGVEVVLFTPADLAGDRAENFFTRLLGAAAAFWEGEPVPSGPFRSALLDE
jgi:hypothetical protein